MSTVQCMQCRECGEQYEKQPNHVCEYCFGPLEVVYDWDKIKQQITREKVERGPDSMWRYEALLPLDSPPTVGVNSGLTPLVRAHNLGKKLGLNNLWVKNDSVNSPTLSFKDRVVSVAISKAKEFGFEVVGCASTGNLANSVAAQAAQAGLRAVIFIPADLNPAKVMGTQIYGAKVVGVTGTYDDVNRLCSEIAAKYPWGFANVNLRPFYGEGSKTYGYEIAEQLGWRAPDHVVVPVGGASLITKIHKALKEFEKLGLISEVHTKMYAAQTTGCAPVSTAVKNGWEMIRPVKPNTIDKSIAIGNPADGYYAIQTVNKSGGYAEDVTDEELVAGIKLLAETEGIFTETAGGVTVGVTKKLAEQGRFGKDDCVVISVTGQGLKTTEVVAPTFDEPVVISPTLSDVDRIAGTLG
ncbi:MAG: threonine synthase [Armatimonadetes bacterium]|nr:threonine synthase [Armatimonadota bacterium]